MDDGPGHERRGLRSIAEHTAAVLARVEVLPVVELSLAEAALDGLGLVLAGDIEARSAVPPFDNAAMDGYAVRSMDLPDEGSVTLPVVGDVRPGDPPPAEHAVPGAVRIMTGAPLPAWADAVVPVEQTSTGRFVAGAPAAEREVTLARQPRAHVRRAGEDVQPGEALGGAGDRVTPGLVAVAAAAGLTMLPVHRRPRVAVVSTGSELVDLGAGRLPEPGRLPDSNSLMLAALGREAGADVVRMGAVPDDAAALHAALDRVVERAVDLVVTSGGVSAGASDVVREVLARGDATDVDVANVAMRPGRPQALARWRGVPWIAVPGSPVSAFVSFVLFARPALARLAGVAGMPTPAIRRAAVAWASPPGREHVVPVRVLPSGEVVPTTPLGRVPGGGGHHVSALLAADGLALVPASAEKVEAGDEVAVVELGDPA